MYQREETIVAREVAAIQIPDGTRTVLAAGTRVWITQSLGGSYTVIADRGAMYRIDERDADALGKEPPKVVEEAVVGNLEERVWGELKKCYNPEIPVNIVDLGLVYDCRVEPFGEASPGQQKVTVRMTLTAPGCGMGDVLAADVRRRVENLPTVKEADVDVVFDPPWNQNMMSDAAKLQLGLF